ncbi:hypothetical protein [Terriglobus sp. RCC_193]|uniref:hypothetical protein n=1 Tax=Terriglobus sp. RCC_193 TaxID=3239218 RepID=UPI003523EFDA
MEVHVPEEPVMTWRQFFIHMGIVVLGLLIALSFEQSAEWLHRRHQRHEVREGIQRDLEIIATNAEGAQRYYEAMVMRDARVIRQTQDAFLRHTAIPELPAVPGVADWDQPNDPSYQAAKASGRLALLSEDEIRVFSEVDGPIQNLTTAFNVLDEAGSSLNEFSARFGMPGATENTWKDATPDDVRRYMAALAAQQNQARSIALNFATIHAIAEQAVHGERDLQTIYKAENEAYLKALQHMQ